MSGPAIISQLDSTVLQDICPVIVQVANADENAVPVQNDFSQTAAEADQLFMEMLDSLETAREQKVKEKERQIDSLVANKVCTKKEKREDIEVSTVQSSSASPEHTGGREAKDVSNSHSQSFSNFSSPIVHVPVVSSNRLHVHFWTSLFLYQYGLTYITIIVLNVLMLSGLSLFMKAVRILRFVISVIETIYAICTEGPSVTLTMFPWFKRVWDVMFPDGKANSTNDKPDTVPVPKPAPANLSVKRTELIENRTKNSRKLARTDLTFRQDTEILKFTPDDEDVTQVSKYNFKIKVTINDMEPILAELDSDSHISLISERYYNQLLEQGPVEFLMKNPCLFKVWVHHYLQNTRPLCLMSK